MRTIALILIAALVFLGCGRRGSGNKSLPDRPGQQACSTLPAGASPPNPQEATSRPAGASTQPRSPGPGRPKVVAATMLQVNDRFITLQQVLHPVRRELAGLAAGAGEEAFRREALKLIRREIRNQVEQTVLVAEAEKELTEDDKKAVGEEVSGRLRQIIAETGSRARFEEQLREEGIDLPAWEENLRRVLMVNAYLGRRFGPRIRITRNMMWDYYEAHRDEFRTREAVQMQMVAAPLGKFLPADRAPTEEDRQAARSEAKRRIEEAAAALAGGEDMAEAAKKFSKGPMAASGGVWPMMERGSFRAEELEQVAFAQKAGQVSGIVETPLGFYIVKTVDRRPGGQRPFDQVQAEIRENLSLQQYRSLRQEYLKDLDARTTIALAERFEQVAVEAAVRMFLPEP